MPRVVKRYGSPYIEYERLIKCLSDAMKRSAAEFAEMGNQLRELITRYAEVCRQRQPKAQMEAAQASTLHQSSTPVHLNQTPPASQSQQSEAGCAYQGW